MKIDKKNQISSDTRMPEQKTNKSQVLGLYENLSLRNLLGGRKFEHENIFPRNVSSPIKKPVFVVGCPRSGTTVVGSCLMAHSKLSGSDESLFFIDMWRIFSSLHQGLNRRKWAPLHNYISAKELLESIGKFSDSILMGLNLTDGRRCIDHTPLYINLIPFINLIYPDCVFIHIIRYGLDVISSLTASYNKGFWWAGKDMKERSIFWNDLVVEGIQNGRNLPNERYLEIHYENFCVDPKGTIDLALQFLDLNFEDKCLIPLTIPHVEPSRKDAMLAHFDSSNNLRINPLNPPCVSNLNYSLEELQIFETYAFRAINLCGYGEKFNKMKSSMIQ